jgi:hypothetical protein
MSNIYFADEMAIDRTISEHRGALERVRPEKKKQIRLSLTGVGVQLEQADKLRPLTLPEKIELLKSLLEANNLLARRRPTGLHDSRPYVLEQSRAVRVVVPDGQSDRNPRPAFSFWLSPADEECGQLCLMEGSGADAENPYNYAKASTYTVLQSLVHFARQQRRPGNLRTWIPSDPHPNEFAKVDETHPPSLIEQYHNVQRFAYDFFTDPEGLLTRWRCDVSSGMNIVALYRVREYGRDSAANFQRVSTFGYALAVEGSR